MPTNDALDPAQLPAGPALDVQVQRVVFRTKIRSIRCPNDNPDWPMFIPSGKPWRTHAIDAVPVPKYSSSIEAAWKVIAHFTEGPDRHPCLHHFEMAFYAGESQWCVAIGGRECGRPGRPFRLSQEQWSESLPLAICRAALSAVAMASEDEQ